MHLAAYKGHTAIVRWLHEQGFDAAAEMDTGRTPAIIASKRGDIEMLGLLEEIGVDVWADNSVGQDAFDQAKDSETEDHLNAMSLAAGEDEQEQAGCHMLV